MSEETTTGRESEMIHEVVALCRQLAESRDPMVRQAIRRVLPSLFDLQEEVDVAAAILTR